MGESWRQRLRAGGSLLFGASVLLLLIAAINVGCLLLARFSIGGANWLSAHH